MAKASKQLAILMRPAPGARELREGGAIPARLELVELRIQSDSGFKIVRYINYIIRMLRYDMLLYALSALSYIMSSKKLITPILTQHLG